jgi:hypothetical protein
MNRNGLEAKVPYCLLRIQSLVIPFAFLIHNPLDAVLSLLELTAVQDRSARSDLV